MQIQNFVLDTPKVKQKDEPELITRKEAADLLGIPYDKVTQGGLFPIAYTIGTDFKPAIREPLSKVLHWEKW